MQPIRRTQPVQLSSALPAMLGLTNSSRIQAKVRVWTTADRLYFNDVNQAGAPAGKTVTVEPFTTEFVPVMGAVTVYLDPLVPDANQPWGSVYCALGPYSGG